MTKEVITRMTWTVVYKEEPSGPQLEYVRYTPEAANTFANKVQNNGGVAIVVETEEIVDVSAFKGKGLQW